MPKVRLGIQEGDTFRLEDLLYSLMLESHNDSAVVIAEHVAGSVEAFAELMNEKAEELGCQDTYFITPNGLDARDETGIHGTTARDLALLLSYCLKNEAFLKITRTADYSFSNTEGTKQYSCYNFWYYWHSTSYNYSKITIKIKRLTLQNEMIYNNHIKTLNLRSKLRCFKESLWLVEIDKLIS